MDGVTTGLIKANGDAKATGVRAKKLEEEAKLVVHDAIEALMTKQVLPQLLKP